MQMSVALCVAAAVAVGGGVTALVRKVSKERSALFAETNAALASLAAKTGLVAIGHTGAAAYLHSAFCILVGATLIGVNLTRPGFWQW